MNATSIGCDDRPLRAVLHNESFGAEQEELMRHVEQCSHCQRRLEQLAASFNDWQNVGEALSDDSPDEHADHSKSAAAGVKSRFRFSRWLDNTVSWTESMAKQMLSPPSHPEMLGRLGRYEVERMIGAGGMGVVFKAFDSELNRPVAVKVLAPFLSGSGAARKRFAREARAAAAIVHEHVVPIHNVETERDAPFLVMQYIAGESLQARIDRTGPLQTCEILRIGMQIASGLSAAHQQGLVHRDIKPSNILMEQGVERALITDFGLARAADDATLTRSGFHPGTPQFMSPEQAAGDPVDARSDLFSLGSVLYTMCTGRPPFRAESSLGVARRITDDEPRRIREINPNIPEWLCGIIGKLMAKRPSDRFRSAAEVADLLGKCLAHVQQPEFIPLPAEADPRQAIAPRSSPQQFLFGKTRSPRTRISISIVALAGLIAAFFWLGPNDSEALTALQGEWQLVAAEREGKATPADQLFDERLIIKGSKFSRIQTAPNGMEIKGESGRLAFPADSENAIDLKVWEGAAHGLFKLKGDELVLCISRSGGPRPDSFKTTANDSRMLQTFRRKKAPAKAAVDSDLEGDVETAEKPLDGAADRTWEKLWMKKIPNELTHSLDRTAAEGWMRENGFQNIASAEITLEVMKRIAPGADGQSIERDGVAAYLYGLIRSGPPKARGGAIAVYCLFDAEDKMLALQLGPQLVVHADLHGAATQGESNLKGDIPWRAPASAFRPVMAESAPIVACIGPEHPVRLGDTVSLADIAKGLDPEIVRLHVWDWSQSDLSRVLLIQRSELGALSPDGAAMLTQEGETIDLNTKATRQYSGSKVPEGQRITALHVSPSRNYAAATIHVRTDIESLPTDPPTLDTRHFWNLRLLKLDSATNTGEIVGEYPANARPGVSFSADEKSLIYSTDQHSIVRRELPGGAIANTYEPSFGAHGAVGLAASPDGRLVVAAGYQGTIYLWDTPTGKLRLQHDSLRPDGERDTFFRAGVLRFSPDSSKLAMVSGNHIKIMDTASGKIVGEHNDATRPRYVHVHWSQDAKTITLLTSSQRSEYGAPRVYNAKEGHLEGASAERLPRIYEWLWETGEPEVKQYAKNDADGALDAEKP
jgi:uncharacterized protein (TIGR03067 family)